MERQTLAPPSPVVAHTQPPNCFYRPIRPSDYDELKAAHQELFPIDYEHSFYYKAVHSLDRLFSWVAITRDDCGPPGSGRYQEHMVGFVTARLMNLNECDEQDRRYMGLCSSALDRETGVYILTIGVLLSHRGRGVGSALLELVTRHAACMHCVAVFLHVIEYNHDAIKMYQRHEFQCSAHLHNFYHINTGRQPEPSQVLYNAYLYCLYLRAVDDMGGYRLFLGPCCTCAMQLVGTPIRHAWGRLAGCRLCRFQGVGNGMDEQLQPTRTHLLHQQSFPQQVPPPPPQHHHHHHLQQQHHQLNQQQQQQHHQLNQQQQQPHQQGYLWSPFQAQADTRASWGASPGMTSSSDCTALCMQVPGVPPGSGMDPARPAGMLRWLFDPYQRSKR